MKPDIEFYETPDVMSKGWEPMELAPFDGTRVLGLERGDDGEWCDPRIYAFSKQENQWLLDGSFSGEDFGDNPFVLLLWQRLPETPYAPPPRRTEQIPMKHPWNEALEKAAKIAMQWRADPAMAVAIRELRCDYSSGFCEAGFPITPDECEFCGGDENTGCKMIRKCENPAPARRT